MARRSPGWELGELRKRRRSPRNPLQHRQIEQAVAVDLQRSRQRRRKRRSLRSAEKRGEGRSRCSHRRQKDAWWWMTRGCSARQPRC